MTSLLSPATPFDAGTWTDVCATSELVPGRGVAALVRGQPVAVFLLDDGRVFALADHDPWSGVNVLSRGIVGSRGGRVVIASPMYKHHVDLASGEGVEQPETTVAVFAARVVEGRVEIGPRLP